MKEKIYFKNSKGDKLCGILSNPTDDIEKPIVILCHGFSTSKDTRKVVFVEKYLNEEKISSFRFDFFAHGESEGAFENITISEGVDDILNAIKFLKSKGYNRIGLAGSSFGGISALMAASKTDELYVLALFCPVSNYKEIDLEQKSKQELDEWKEKGFRIRINTKGEKLKLNYSFFLDFDNNNGYKAAEKVTIPCFIVHGDADEQVPVEQSIKVADIMKDCTLEIIKDGDHRFTKPEDFDRAVKGVADFIIEHS